MRGAGANSRLHNARCRPVLAHTTDTLMSRMRMENLFSSMLGALTAEDFLTCSEASSCVVDDGI